MSDQTVEKAMDDEQFKSFKKIINYEAMKVLDRFIDAEIEAQPNNKQFLLGVKSSDFFKSFFERGFIEGIMWEKKNKDVKFVLGGKNESRRKN